MFRLFLLIIVEVHEVALLLSFKMFKTFMSCTSSHRVTRVSKIIQPAKLTIAMETFRPRLLLFFSLSLLAMKWKHERKLYITFSFVDFIKQLMHTIVISLVI